MFSSDGPHEVLKHLVQTEGGPKRLPDQLDIFGGDVGSWSKWILLNEAMVEIWIHWLGRRSLPCLNALGECPKEMHSCPLAWRGYIPAVNMHSNRVALLACTYDAVRACPDLAVESTSMGLRGRMVRIQRLPGKKNNPQQIQLIPESFAGNLGPQRNVLAALNIVWCKDPVYAAFIAQQVTGSPPDENFGHPQRPNA